MKTTRMRMGLITAVLAVALVAYWMFLKPPEDPLCKGVPLSEWMAKPDWNRSNSPIQPEDLRAIAPKAAPYLAYYLRTNCPQTRNGLATRMPDWLQRKLPPSWTRPKSVGSSEKCRHALKALGWLGADAEPAIPSLVMLLDAPNYELKSSGAKALYGIGPASWPAVLKAWHGDSRQARYVIVMELPCKFQPSPTSAATEAEKKLAIDLLLDACRGPDYQSNAIEALGRCRDLGGASPLYDPVVPVIIRCMEVGKGEVPRAAARTLPLFPEHARTIIPALKKMAGSSNPEYNREAKRSLESIEEQTPKGE